MPNYPNSPAPSLNLQPMFCLKKPNTYSTLSASLMMKKMPYMGRIMLQAMSINSPINRIYYNSSYMSNNINTNNNLV